MLRLKRKNRQGLPEGGKRDAAAAWSSLIEVEEVEDQYPGLAKA